MGISIIIPCYNIGNYIKDAVLSIINQPIEANYEVLVIDDASDCKLTQNNLNELIKYNNVKVIKLETNKGVQYVRNLGLKTAKYKYILPLDGDDCLNTNSDVLVEGTYIDRAIKVLESNEDIAFVYGISEMFGDFSGYTISAYPVAAKQILMKHHAQTSIIYRKDDAFFCGGYSENILKWQDWSFSIALLNGRFLRNKKNRIEFLDKPYHLYRIHNSTSRISQIQVNEKEMTLKTISMYPEIFKSYYGNLDNEKISDIVIKNKPSKLMDLLQIAKFDINLAIKMVNQRKYQLISNISIDSIP